MSFWLKLNICLVYWFIFDLKINWRGWYIFFVLLMVEFDWLLMFLFVEIKVC